MVKVEQVIIGIGDGAELSRNTRLPYRGIKTVGKYLLRECPDCGKPKLRHRQRFCDDCGKKRRRKTNRQNQRAYHRKHRG